MNVTQRELEYLSLTSSIEESLRVIKMYIMLTMAVVIVLVALFMIIIQHCNW